MIQQDMAKICDIQSKCLTGSRVESREYRIDSRVKRRLIIMFGIVAAMGGGIEVTKACTIECYT